MTIHVYVEDKSMVKIFTKLFEISKMFLRYFIRINKISEWAGVTQDNTARRQLAYTSK